jgi:hypothetical protein
MIRWRWSSLQRKNRKGTLSHEKYELDRNVIMDNILDILNDIEKNELDSRIKNYKLRSYYHRPVLGGRCVDEITRCLY